MLNTGQPTDVNRYMEDFKNNGITEGERYDVLDDDMSGLKDKCRQLAWKSLAVLSGRDDQMSLAMKPADNRWVRCSGDVEY